VSCERITYSVENGRTTERNNDTNTEPRKSHTLINNKVDKGSNDIKYTKKRYILTKSLNV